MSLVSFAAAGTPAAGVPAGRADQANASGNGDQQLEKQQHEQELAHAQRLGDQLHQLFQHQTSSAALANQQAEAAIAPIISSARASASAALSNSGAIHGVKGHGDTLGSNSGLQHAASAVAGARAAINDAKLAALREPEHGDLADLVQLDQQAANQQGTIVINLLV